MYHNEETHRGVVSPPPHFLRNNIRITNPTSTHTPINHNAQPTNVHHSLQSQHHNYGHTPISHNAQTTNVHHSSPFQHPNNATTPVQQLEHQQETLTDRDKNARFVCNILKYIGIENCFQKMWQNGFCSKVILEQITESSVTNLNVKEGEKVGIKSIPKVISELEMKKILTDDGEIRTKTVRGWKKKREKSNYTLYGVPCTESNIRNFIKEKKGVLLLKINRVLEIERRRIKSQNDYENWCIVTKQKVMSEIKKEHSLEDMDIELFECVMLSIVRKMVSKRNYRAKVNAHTTLKKLHNLTIGEWKEKEKERPTSKGKYCSITEENWSEWYLVDEHTENVKNVWIEWLEKRITFDQIKSCSL
jgi:hypothetical protein